MSIEELFDQTSDIGFSLNSLEKAQNLKNCQNKPVFNNIIGQYNALYCYRGTDLESYINWKLSFGDSYKKHMGTNILGNRIGPKGIFSYSWKVRDSD